MKRFVAWSASLVATAALFVGALLLAGAGSAAGATDGGVTNDQTGWWVAGSIVLGVLIAASLALAVWGHKRGPKRHAH